MKSAKCQKPRTSLQFESLENRQLLATVTAHLDRGWLVVDGTQRDDQILVQNVSNRISLVGSKTTHPAQSVKGIFVRGRGGDDTLAVLGGANDKQVFGKRFPNRQPIKAVTILGGGDGNDSIFGNWNARNLLDGSIGDDVIWGGNSNNVISGGRWQ